MRNTLTAVLYVYGYIQSRMGYELPQDHIELQVALQKHVP